MPIYQYRHKQTRKIIDRFRPVAERNDCPPGYERVEVPIGFSIEGLPDPTDADQAVPRSLHQIECEGVRAVKRLERESGFTVQQLRNVWMKNRQYDVQRIYQPE